MALRRYHDFVLLTEDPELADDGNWKDLYTNDSIWTDQFGEAE